MYCVPIELYYLNIIIYNDIIYIKTNVIEILLNWKCHFNSPCKDIKWTVVLERRKGEAEAIVVPVNISIITV